MKNHHSPCEYLNTSGKKASTHAHSDSVTPRVGCSPVADERAGAGSDLRSLTEHWHRSFRTLSTLTDTEFRSPNLGSVVMSGERWTWAVHCRSEFPSLLRRDFGSNFRRRTLLRRRAIYNATAAFMSTWSAEDRPEHGEGRTCRRLALRRDRHHVQPLTPRADVGHEQQPSRWPSGRCFTMRTTVCRSAAGKFYVTPRTPEATGFAKRICNVEHSDGLAVKSGTDAVVVFEGSTWMHYTAVRTGADEKNIQDFIGPAPSPASVPEPGAGLLLGTGIAALAAFRSRKSLLPRA